MLNIFFSFMLIVSADSDYDDFYKLIRIWVWRFIKFKNFWSVIQLRKLQLKKGCKMSQKSYSNCGTSRIDANKTQCCSTVWSKQNFIQLYTNNHLCIINRRRHNSWLFFNIAQPPGKFIFTVNRNGATKFFQKISGDVINAILIMSSLDVVHRTFRKLQCLWWSN